jgi:hypothetical protein
MHVATCPKFNIEPLILSIFNRKIIDRCLKFRWSIHQYTYRTIYIYISILYIYIYLHNYIYIYAYCIYPWILFSYHPTPVHKHDDPAVSWGLAGSMFVGWFFFGCSEWEYVWISTKKLKTYIYLLNLFALYTIICWTHLSNTCPGIPYEVLMGDGICCHVF